MHIHVSDVVKKAAQRYEGDNLKLLSDEFCHGLWQDYHQKENFICQDEAERCVYGIKVIERFPAVEGRSIIEHADERQVSDKKQDSKPDNENFESPNILRGDISGEDISERASPSIRDCHLIIPPVCPFIQSTLSYLGAVGHPLSRMDEGGRAIVPQWRPTFCKRRSNSDIENPSVSEFGKRCTSVGPTRKRPKSPSLLKVH